jgi:hypothetical protein
MRHGTRRALAEIAVDPKHGWMLPRFGKHPFRYHAWAHFENDPTRGSATWTLIVELIDAPDPSSPDISLN